MRFISNVWSVAKAAYTGFRSGVRGEPAPYRSLIGSDVYGASHRAYVVHELRASSDVDETVARLVSLGFDADELRPYEEAVR